MPVGQDKLINKISGRGKGESYESNRANRYRGPGMCVPSMSYKLEILKNTLQLECRVPFGTIWVG